MKTVEENSGAALAGLLPGDRVLSIDGKSIPGGAADQARELLFGKAGSRFKIAFSRKGQAKIVELARATAQ